LPCSYSVFRLSIRCVPRGTAERHKSKRHDYLRAGQSSPSRRLNQRYEREICAFKPACGGSDRHNPQRIRKPSISSLAGGYCEYGLRQFVLPSPIGGITDVCGACCSAPEPQTNLNIPCIGGGLRCGHAVLIIRYIASREGIIAW